MSMKASGVSTRRLRRARADSLVSTLAIAILGAVALLCVAMIAPILWTAILDSGSPKLGACDSIKVSQRDACLEAQRANGGHPAKGATAPLGATDR